ncbi:MAG: UDP-3-O-(3-hydroxymyristoyl)glucosamine N-acyltransferase [Limnochordales bacterium]|nr:UDP-3-O-(3-hydroxymyristoyl)glucosamine N-acyltransferase [Limnochordales bacterium]
MPQYSLGELARRLDTELHGPPDLLITSVAAWDEAQEGAITLAMTERIARQVAAGRAAAVLTSADLLPFLGEKPALVASRPRLAFARLLALFSERPLPQPGIHPAAVVAPDAYLGRDVTIGPFAVVESGAWIGDRVVIAAGAYVGAGARIGDETLIGPHAVVYDGVVLGRRVVLQAGAVVGSDGFGYERAGEEIVHLPHIGTVVLEDEVEVGANTTIDRATCVTTRIGRRTKIDNLVQIGHNVTVGAGCLIAGQAGIGGSACLEDNVTLAGQTGVADHARVGKEAVIAARGVAVGYTPGGRMLSGFPAHDHAQELQVLALVRRLPRLVEEIRSLRARVTELEARLGVDKQS